jgi:hypothetical protein
MHSLSSPSWRELHDGLAPTAVAGFCTKYGPAAALELALFFRQLTHEMKACAESIVATDTLAKGNSLDNFQKSLMQDCEMLVARSWDVFLDEQHGADVEKEWNEAISRMCAVAKREGREHDLEWLEDVQFLKGDIVEQVSKVLQPATHCQPQR